MCQDRRPTLGGIRAIPEWFSTQPSAFENLAELNHRKRISAQPNRAALRLPVEIGSKMGRPSSCQDGDKQAEERDFPSCSRAHLIIVSLRVVADRGCPGSRYPRSLDHLDG